MEAIVEFVLLAFPAFGLVFLLVLPRGKAILAVTIVGWLFLPVASIEVQGIPSYSKATAVGLVLLVGAFVFDLGRVLALRPGLPDLLMTVWCVVPVATAISNDLTLKSGLSGMVGHITTWGAPYLAGRLYFADARGMRELALATVAAGLIYVPFCLFEVRMSPVLHEWVYGFHQHTWAQARRGGGWRPTVFLQHGLAVGLLIGTSAVLAGWLWVSGVVRRAWGLPMSGITGALLLTTLLCKSFGAIALAAAGLGVLIAARSMGLRAIAAAFVLVAPCYIALRLTGKWSGDSAVAAAALVSEERAGSLKFRLDAEALLIARAMERPVLGWDGYARNRVSDTEGHDLAVTDGFWVLAAGKYGLVGLAGVWAVLTLPALRAVRRAPLDGASDPTAATALGLSMVLTVYALDSLLNAMPNPIFHMAAGSLAGASLAPSALRRAAARVADPGESGRVRVRDVESP